MSGYTVDEIKNIGRLLLPPNSNFSEEQISAIMSHHSFDVVACPGSGKTAALITKIALLLKQLDNDKQAKGICVITHTNVGVSEILDKLKLVGINNITHPHFIGTIHDFFNSFFSIRAYDYLMNNNKNLVFLEDDEFFQYCSKVFNRNKPAWWTSPLARTAITNSQLYINDDMSFRLVGLEDRSEQYKGILLNTFKDVLKQGILCHRDSLILCDWYTRYFKSEITKAIRNRFSFVFMDETQDTSQTQYLILERIFNEENTVDDQIVVQKFGDPYQALYNLWNGEEDSWVPDEEKSLQISTSNCKNIKNNMH
ncbi:superfamily I DNA/RNA helicase [Paenibacillus sp. V4I3]|uniref:UvrD-helicase domain-containing protein n=1 Tax=Paenibacillus sp. V4I3 TaxID=3042305 RepID=UPI00278737A1|nr:UvrD-helicase domain-containing protein [Paenibacillus sp. V4I3]MDQ0876137.1 superfamily I DNA/RNA helicase [Paenibacillus sp. V4I3]